MAPGLIQRFEHLPFNTGENQMIARSSAVYQLSKLSGFNASLWLQI